MVRLGISLPRLRMLLDYELRVARPEDGESALLVRISGWTNSDLTMPASCDFEGRKIVGYAAEPIFGLSRQRAEGSDVSRNLLPDARLWGAGFQGRQRRNGSSQR